MNKLKLLSMMALVSFNLSLSAQPNSLIIQNNINLPKDSSERENLILSLNGFLSETQKPNEENKYIFEPEKIETFILLDEINGIEKNTTLNDDHFYKPYLMNVVPFGDGLYLVQITYSGLQDGEGRLRAVFEIVAHKTGELFTFSSPLLRNTTNWKILISGNNKFHYKKNINKKKVAEYQRLTSSFDEKLNGINKATDIYCTDNLPELQKLVGVLYKSDYNGRAGSVWSSVLGDRKLLVLGNKNAEFDHFDPHDLFHERLSMVVPRSKVNKAVDEGCAYLYGGSWGMSWNEIFKAFKDQIAINRSASWTELKETPVFFKTGQYNNQADYIVNALLVKKIEKEKGFAGVWELLNTGPIEKGNEKYYQVLEKLTGISKANYIEEIWKLIESE